MSDQGIDRAVERILADPAFARKVLEDPERTLTSNFDLESGEWRSISWCLQQDVKESAGEVHGHALQSLNMGTLNYRYVKAIPQLKGSFDRKAFTPTVNCP